MDSTAIQLGGMVLVRKKHGEQRNEKRGACTGGASTLYTFPTQGSTVDTSAGPVVFTWNSACLDSSIIDVDLTLYAPSLAQPIIKAWSGIPASAGSYSVTLLPKWWNATDTVQLQMTLSSSDTGGLSFLTSAPAGPVFDATYPKDKLVVVTQGSTVAAPAANTAILDPVYTTASILKSGLPAGSVFAAVFFPIIIVLAAVFVYVRWLRAKQAKKRERWSKAIDNRMSVISTNWNPGSSPDPRKSISSAANRRDQVGSVYSTSEGRPSQSSHLRDVSGQQEMSQTSFARPATSVFLASGEQRASRVSFAFVDTPNNRVSFAEGGDHSPGPGRKSFAASHGRGISQGQGQQRPSISIYDADGTRLAGSGGRGRRSEDMISPDQAMGPHVLGEDDVEEELSSMAAVRMMHTHHHPSSSSPSIDHQLHHTVPSIARPSPAHTLPNTSASPIATSYFPNGAPSPNISPDDMLRDYASARAAGTPGGSAGGRRMTVVAKPGENNPFRKSMAAGGEGGGAEEMRWEEGFAR